MAENAISTVFNRPGIAGFTLLRSGVKFPPFEEGWQKKGHSFEEAMAHRGNIGLLAGNGYIGLDKDKPEAFNGLTLSSTTTWETRPGRLGMWFKCNDRTPEVIAKYGFKKPDHAQIKLYDGRNIIDGYHPHIGEIKLERTYQVIPPSWKIVDGQRVDYKMLEEVPPAEISLDWLLSELLRIGIAFSEKPKARRYEANAKKLEGRKKDAATRKQDKTAKAREFLLEAGMGAKPGHRNDKGFWLACQLRDLGLDAGEASEYMREYAKALSNSEAEPYTEDEAMESLKQAYSRTPRELPTSQTHQESKALKEPRPESQTSETEAERHRREHAEANPSFLRADADRFEAEHPGCKIFNCDDDPKPNEISEEDASKYAIPSNPKLVLTLERDNFISQFMAYGSELSDAYSDFWFMGALELLAIINDQKTYVNIRTERVYPNVYINLLGSSTTSHKSTILKKVAAILERISNGKYHEAPENGSPEGWLEAMSETPRAYCNQDESSGFLNRMKKQDYMSGMTEMLNNCYDGTSFTKRNTKKRRGEPNQWRIEHPYYNQLYATTPTKFSFATSAIDIHSGFWVRFLHAYPNYDRDQFTPLGEASNELAALDEAVVERLLKICDQMSDPTVTRATLEPDGWEFYKQWQVNWNKKIRKTNDDFLGQIVGRYTIYAIKLGMHFTMGRSDFTREKMVVSMAHIKEACALVDSYFVPHALAVRDLIGEGSAKDANLIIKIETVLRVHSGRLSHREMLRKIKVVRKQLDEALNTMQVSGAVTIRYVKNPHGRPTETIFLNGEDNVILSPQERQYEKHDTEVESKKAKSDNMEKSTIHKTTTSDRIRDTVSPYCHIVTDEIVNGDPDVCVGGSTKKSVTISIMKDNHDAPPQKKAKNWGDNMGDNMVTICHNRHHRDSETVKNDFSDNIAPTIGPHPRKDEPTPATKIKEDVAGKHTKKVLSYSDMVQFVPYDTSSPEAQKICTSIRGQLARCIAPRMDFVRIDTKLSGEIVQTYLDNAQWLKKDDSAPSGIVVYLPNVPQTREASV